MKTIKRMTAIIVLDSDTNGNLTLSDKGKPVVVKENEVVTWIIHPDSGVESITAIPVKAGSTNIFTTGPGRLGRSKNWQGRIGKEFRDTGVKFLEEKSGQKFIQEEYSIVWKDSNGKKFTFDPKLRINI